MYILLSWEKPIADILSLGQYIKGASLAMHKCSDIIMCHNNIDLSNWRQVGTAMKNQEIPKGMEVVTGFQVLLAGIP